MMESTWSRIEEFQRQVKEKKIRNKNRKGKEVEMISKNSKKGQGSTNKKKRKLNERDPMEKSDGVGSSGTLLEMADLEEESLGMSFSGYGSGEENTTDYGGSRAEGTLLSQTSGMESY